MESPQNTQTLELTTMPIDETKTVIWGQRGSYKELIGTLNFDPELPKDKHFFTNYAVDLFCFVDKGNGYERLYSGIPTPFNDIFSIGYGRGKVEGDFYFKHNLEDD